MARTVFDEQFDALWGGEHSDAFLTTCITVSLVVEFRVVELVLAVLIEQRVARLPLRPALEATDRVACRHRKGICAVPQDFMISALTNWHTLWEELCGEEKGDEDRGLSGGLRHDKVQRSEQKLVKEGSSKTLLAGALRGESDGFEQRRAVLSRL